MRPRNLTSRGRRRAALFVFFLPLFLLTSDFVLRTSLKAQAAINASVAVPTPPSIPISPRRAAAFGAVIVSSLLLLQYAHRRKPFILVWALGWLLIAPAMLLIARDYDGRIAGLFALGLSQFLGICTATLFFWSADLYRQTRFVRPSRLRVLIAVGAWFLIAPLLFGPGAVLKAGYLICAVLLAAAGSMYAAVLIERRMIGAGLVAFVLLGLGVSNLTTAVVVPRLLSTSQFNFEVLVVNAVLYTFGALGIHQLVFEDMTYELRMTNRRLEAAREELLQAAITDPLTGCHNRRFLEQVMDRELQRHARFQLPLSLLFIDVDKFKQINDTLGHEAGDRVLQVRRPLPQALHPRGRLRVPMGRRRVPGADHLRRRRSGAQGGGVEGVVRRGARSGGDAAGDRAERRVGRGAARHGRSPAAGQGGRQAHVRRQGTGRGVARDVDAQGASGAGQEELARYRIARRPPTRRPMPSATVAFCSAP